MRAESRGLGGGGRGGWNCNTGGGVCLSLEGVRKRSIAILWEEKPCPALGGWKVCPQNQNSGLTLHPPFWLVLHQLKKKPEDSGGPRSGSYWNSQSLAGSRQGQRGHKGANRRFAQGERWIVQFIQSKFNCLGPHCKAILSFFTPGR